MTVFIAIGPDDGTTTLEIRQVVRAGLAADVPDAPAGQRKVNITALVGALDPNSFVGRKITTAAGASPTLDAVTLADQRPAWFARIGGVYRTGLDHIRFWWPRQRAHGAGRDRAQFVIDHELPNWWRGTVGICSAAARGTTWPSMTAAQVEACVAHLEALLVEQFPAADGLAAAAGVIQWWYYRGADYDFSDHAPNQGEHMVGGVEGTLYANRATVLTGYSDCYEVAASILTPRRPDYGFIASLIGANAEPADFDPENPT